MCTFPELISYQCFPYVLHIFKHLRIFHVIWTSLFNLLKFVDKIFIWLLSANMHLLVALVFGGHTVLALWSGTFWMLPTSVTPSSVEDFVFKHPVNCLNSV